MNELHEGGTAQVSRRNEERMRSAVGRLLSSYEPPPDAELREAERSSFFAPVSLLFDGDAFPRYSAFAHDISPSGIGLLHVMPLQLGEVIVAICHPRTGPMSFRTQITYCKAYGEVWYRSGGRFLELIEV
jgi:hypothetical protein